LQPSLIPLSFVRPVTPKVRGFESRRSQFDAGCVVQTGLLALQR